MSAVLQGELRDLLENNPLGVAVMRHEPDGDGGVTARRIFANDSLRELFGAATMAELVRRPVLESWVDISALEYVNRAFAARAPLSGYEVERVRPDGSRFWVSMTGQPIVLDGEELTIVWHLDITARKQAEKDLRDSETQIRDYMESSVDWFWEMDADLRFTYLSSNIERIAGIQPRAQYGKTREELLDPGYDRSIWEAHLEALKARQPFRDFIYPLTTENGTPAWISTSGKPIFSEQGEFLGYRGTGNDVTARIENQELRAASRAKSDFLSQMSHELRTPLNGILGYSQILENDRAHPLTPRQQLAVGQIQRGGEHLLDLINRVLDLAAIENRSVEPVLETVGTKDILEDCLGMAEVMASEKKLSVKGPAAGMATPSFVRADRTRLRQVLLNLLSNAVKYNVEGGSVTLNCVAIGETVRFEVSDTGPGIPTRDQDKVFTPFSRLSSTHGDVEGTGIGLSITRDLVKLMEGEIGFDSVEGRGTTFWVTLPAADETVDAPKPDGDIAQPASNIFSEIPLPDATILYVEDNPANAKLMEMIVEETAALTLYSASTAEAGIELVHLHRPDIILMDLNLPGMSGSDALRVLRDDPETRDIPVIAVSANALREGIEASRIQGFDDYVTKPFDIRRLLTTLAKMLANADETETLERAIESRGNYAPLRDEETAKLFASARFLPPTYIDVLRRQAATLPDLANEMRGALRNKAPGDLERAAHKLKSNAATFGAGDIRVLAQRIEKHAQDGLLADVPELIDQIETGHAALSPIIDRLLEDLKSA